MTVEIINKSKHDLPKYETSRSAGMDLRANLENSVELLPLDRCIIPTGLYMSLDEGFEAQVRPRSGLAAKKRDNSTEFSRDYRCRLSRRNRGNISQSFKRAFYR
jgi:dUTPase